MPPTVADRPERIVRLTSAPREMEAGLIVAALEQGGIKATMTGAATAGFRAEAPGWVHVLVAERDLPSAYAMLCELRHEGAEIDWSQVDVGEPEEQPELPEPTSRLSDFKFWRRVAYVLVIIYLLWWAAGFIAGFGPFLLRKVGIWP